MEYQTLEARIAACIAAGGPADDEAFGELAREIHRFQRRWNTPYGNYCRGFPAPADWREIPAAPQSAFKQFALRAFPEEETARTFRTSGTTGEGYGSHHFRSLRLYEASILAGWRHFGLPENLPQIVLIARPEAAPHSSLSHMMGTLGALGPQSYVVRADGSLDVPRLRQLCKTAEPVLVLGTALAFLHFFEATSGERWTLPPGSQAMETGGYKGSGRTLAKADLYALFADRLGLQANAVINEYGMTELSSPFYSRGLGRPHAGPPWTRALVIDPETGEEGAVGTVRLFDLANLGSSLAIQTQDLARSQGDGRFELLGRDPAALPRGCSRAADETMAGARA